ncbi:MAG: hypothetical protein KC592_19240, partial [Nitrospira sp.]|nr:hypothetical protein [Nitrospira sp.]
MSQKPSKKPIPEVIDIVAESAPIPGANEEVHEEILLDEAQEKGGGHENEKASEIKSTWDSVSTALSPTTTLSRYLAEVRRYPFLSKEEELQLF